MNRYYISEYGRYSQSDPIGLAGGINPYMYAGENPVNLIDPLGLECSLLQQAANYLTQHGDVTASFDAGAGPGVNASLSISRSGISGSFGIGLGIGFGASITGGITVGSSAGLGVTISGTGGTGPGASASGTISQGSISGSGGIGLGIGAGASITASYTGAIVEFPYAGGSSDSPCGCN